MNHASKWLQDWLPDVHIQWNGATGGWTAVGETGFGAKLTLEFQQFPNAEQIADAAQAELRRRRGREI